MKKLILLLFFTLLLTGCQKQETDVEVLFDSITDGVGLGSSFYGLEPVVATKRDVADRMSSYPYLSDEQELYPEAIDYSSGTNRGFQMINYMISPDVGFSVYFYLTLEDRLTNIEISPMNLMVEDVLMQYGEPDAVFFAVWKDRYNACFVRLYYDDPQLVFHLCGKGSVNWEQCRITEKNEIHTISIVSGFDYVYDAENFLVVNDYEGSSTQFIHEWRGYGNLFELYPVHPVLGFKANQ